VRLLCANLSHLYPYFRTLLGAKQSIGFDLVKSFRNDEVYNIDDLVMLNSSSQGGPCKPESRFLY
jgi:hypothetical protein